MLTIQGLSVRYGGIVALNDVSIQVNQGESVLLVGSNGAGKSSLINAVMGLAPLSSGRIVFEGKDLARVSAPARARMGIGYSPEGRRVFRSLSVAENVLSGPMGLRQSEALANLDWVQRTFPLLAQRARQPANHLSGGEQQIVAIARAISTLPKLLLLDEPFLGLAPVWIGRISEAVRELQRRGTAILMTEQMARPALKLAHRAYVMRGGVVRRSGSVEEIRELALAEEYL
jgi:branched-chain amino acid transport system ATP-binding protein